MVRGGAQYWDGRTGTSCCWRSVVWDLSLPSSPSLSPASIPCPHGKVSLPLSWQCPLTAGSDLPQGLLQLSQARPLPVEMQVLL